MVETGQLSPGLGGMAGPAAASLSVAGHLEYALAELALMGIFVATRAGQIIPAIDDGRNGSELRARFVAIPAGRGDVSACKWELRFLVPNQRERGGLVTFKRMALFAAVEIRSRSELPSVFVSVAVGAVLELNFE